MGTADSLRASRLFASIDAVNKSDNAGLFRGRLPGVLFFFKQGDHQPKLYGFMTYLRFSTETKRLPGLIRNWGGFHARLSRIPPSRYKNQCRAEEQRTFVRRHSDSYAAKDFYTMECHINFIFGLKGNTQVRRNTQFFRLGHLWGNSDRAVIAKRNKPCIKSSVEIRDKQ